MAAKIIRFLKGNPQPKPQEPVKETPPVQEPVPSEPEQHGERVKDTVNDGTNRSPDWSFHFDNCTIDAWALPQVKKWYEELYLPLKKYSQRIAEGADTFVWVPALLHSMENGKMQPNIYLHNGQTLGRTTTIVPKGIYFPNSIEGYVEAGIDALKSHKLAGQRDLKKILTFMELFNGAGYRSKVGDSGEIELSPYMAAGTSAHDETGKYIRDRVYDRYAKTQQIGVLAKLKYIEDREGLGLYSVKTA